MCLLDLLFLLVVESSGNGIGAFGWGHFLVTLSRNTPERVGRPTPQKERRPNGVTGGCCFLHAAHRAAHDACFRWSLAASARGNDHSRDSRVLFCRSEPNPKTIPSCPKTISPRRRRPARKVTRAVRRHREISRSLVISTRTARRRSRVVARRRYLCVRRAPNQCGGQRGGGAALRRTHH